MLQEKSECLHKVSDKKSKVEAKAEKGEGMSRSLFNRAKPRLKKIPIRSLVDPVTKLRYTDASSKLRIATNFWKRIFTKPEGAAVEHDSAEVFFRAIKRKLTHMQAASINHKLTSDELYAALDNLNDSTPGSTGLTPSFYKKFWHTGLGDRLTSAINSSLQNGDPLPKFMREARVVLLYKDGNVEDPANYRPISLLNTAYKIFTTALCIRLATVAPDLISRDQIGFMCNRFIGEVPLTLNLVATFCHDNKIDAGVLICDQQKAYDSVLHEFMEKFLIEFGIGQYFASMVMLCYKDALTALVIDGKVGEFFNQTRGVRQGCPLSCLLFDLCMECLSGVIDDKITGIPLTSPHVADAHAAPLKAKFFADDTTIFFTPQDELNIERHMRLWTKASGMKWHPKKTKVLWLGPQAGSQEPFIGYSAIKEDEVFKLLGIHFDSNAQYSMEQWEVVHTKLANRLPLARVLNLSIFGRAMLANSYAASLVWYPTQCLMELPKRAAKRIERAIFYYLWKGKKVGQVRREKCIGPKLYGGTGLINIQDECTAMIGMWVRRLTDPSNTHWKTLFLHYISFMTYPYNLGVGLFDPAANCINIPAGTPDSFKLIIKNWRKISATPDRSNLHPDQIQAQNIFYNSSIKSGLEVIDHKFKHLAKARITHLGDLVGKDLQLRSHYELQQVCKKLTYDEYLEIVCAIPARWLTILRSPPPALDQGDFVQWIYTTDVCEVYEPFTRPMLSFTEQSRDYDGKLTMDMEHGLGSSKGTPTSVELVHTERMDKISVPFNKEAVNSTPRYYFQSWKTTTLNWRQLQTIDGPLRTSTVKGVRLALFKHPPNDSPERWAEDLNKPQLKNWYPKFEVYSVLDLHPKVYNVMWLILHHSLPVKARLHKHGHPDVLTPYCPHHPDGINRPETIAHALFCSTVRPVWAWVFHIFKLITDQPPPVEANAILGAPERDLMQQLLQEWDIKAPMEQAIVWQELLAITVFSIVKYRNKIGLDDLRSNTPALARKHAMEVR